MKVLNFGSLNIDYVYDVDDFVKKGETISSKALNVFSGGKGLNQSVALTRAGAEVYHAGMIGEDGKFLLDLLKEAGVNTDKVLIRGDIRTGNAIIQRDKSGDNCIILFAGANRSITKDYVDSVLSGFEKGDYIVLQNEISELPYIVENAHKIGMKIVLNPSPMDEKIKELNLKTVNTSIERSEELIKNSREIYDIALCRGVANLRIILEYMIPFIKVNGRFLPQKLNLNEIEESKKALKILNAKINNIFEFKLPENEDKRIILEILKLKKTSEKYPRKTGIPAKKPL